jgi:hypothetical protein
LQVWLACIVLGAGACVTDPPYEPNPGSPELANPAYRNGCTIACVPAPSLLHHVLGDDLRAALRAADTPRIVADIDLRISDEPFGTVLAQVPWPGEPARLEGGITLVLSGGPVGGATSINWCGALTVSMCGGGAPSVTAIRIEDRGFRIEGEPADTPDVTGMTRTAAARALTAAGFYYRVVPRRGPDDDHVVAQLPRGDSVAHAASEIILFVRCDPQRIDVPESADLYDPCGGDMHELGLS